jgi:hypothetical protein
MYQNRTSFFGIPVPASGEKIKAADELTKARIIENQLLAASKGAFCVVYEDGTYSCVKTDDGTFIVRCSSYGGQPALMGVLNCGLAQTYSTIKWTGLVSGFLYYLYVEWTPTLYEDETSFRVFSLQSRVPQTNKNLLLATIDLTGTTPVIDSSPDGKLYVKDFSQHIGDNINPHTDSLVQDILTVRKTLIAAPTDETIVGGAIVINDTRGTQSPSVESKGELVLADVRARAALSDAENPVLKTKSNSIIGGINELADRYKVTVVSSSYGGTGGVTLSVEGAIGIVGATVSTVRGGVPSGGTGEVEVEYSSDAEGAPRPDQFRVYNSGSAGGSFRAVVVYE